ncbi:hypothetical protein CRE_03000 [Caenorhabditis remanei]|uniref:Endonuclease/exonuclease/phosphatase domain-containing protein n=1 Tax=Caenorhabditis remanei TaxID=31234 RepID=E3LX44_CAERE|nr:hypothetical protein CRE_03000 [Caenorhabditis remanei]
MKKSSSPEKQPEGSKIKPRHEQIPSWFRIGTWNCGSLLGIKFHPAMQYCEDSQCDVVALQETNHGTKKSKYTKNDMIYMPRNNAGITAGELKYNDGLAFFVRENPLIKNIQHRLIHARVAIMEFEYKDVKFVIFNCYAPVSKKNSEEKAEDFYKLLSEKLVKNFISNGINIICGDMNAEIQSAKNGSLEPHIKNHVYIRKTQNKHGDILHKFLILNNLFLLNSRFSKGQDRKWTRAHYDKKKSKSEIDFFISDRIDLVEDVDVVERDAKEKDHRMVTSTWRISKQHKNEYKRLLRHKELGRESWCPFRNVLCHNDTLFTITTYSEFEELLREESQHQMFKLIIDHLRKVHSSKDENEELKNSILPVTAKEGEEHIPSITRKEVRDELRWLRIHSQTRITNLAAEMKKMTDKNSLNNLTDRFNKILQGGMIPDWWKTVIFELPNQTLDDKKVENYEYAGHPFLLQCVYAGILGRRLFLNLKTKITESQCYFKQNVKDVGNYRSKAIEHIFTLTMLIEKHNQFKRPIYLVFIKIKDSLTNIKPSAIIETLIKFNAENYLIMAFHSLFSQRKAKISPDSESFDINLGFHLGENASAVLMNVLLQRIFEECDNQLADCPVGIQINKRCLRRLQFDDQLVLIGASPEHVGVHLEKLSSVSEKYGLIIDKNRLVLLKNSCNVGKNQFFFYGNRIQVNTRVQMRSMLFLNRHINVDETLFLEIQNRTVHSFLTSENYKVGVTAKKQTRKMFFVDKVLPVFFFACETWKPSKKEFEELNESLKKLLTKLRIKNFNLDIKSYVLSKRARWIGVLARTNDSICCDLLRGWRPPNGNGAQDVSMFTHWSFDLVIKFKEFNRTSLKQKIDEKSITGHDLIKLAKENKSRWKKFVKFCKTVDGFDFFSESFEQLFKI